MAAKRETAERTRNSPRIDMRPKVTGSAKYIEDLPEPEGFLYGAVLASPYSHARIVSIDSAQAERLPGVVGVLHRDYIGDFYPLRPLPRNEHFKLTPDQPFMAIDKVRFNGEVVAIVAAADLRTAERALEFIDVTYDPLSHVYDGSEALRPGAPLVHEQKETNLLLEDKLEWGDIDQGFTEADRIFEETYRSPAMFHHPMENVGGCIARFADGKIDLLVPTNAPFRDANEIAHFFKMAPEDVRLRVPFIGGGFGSKNIINAHLAALFLSRQLGGRPIKLVPSAQDSFKQNSRHAMLFKAKMGVKLDGTITALQVDLVVDTGAYITGAATATHNAVISGWGCYRIPHLRVYGRCAYTNKVPAGHTRATGKVQTTWAIECTVDSVARQLGIDPVAFRKKNVLARGEFVTKGTPHMDTDFLELIDRATRATEAPVADTQQAPSPRRRIRGKGMALSLRHGSFGGGQTDALASLDAKGMVTLRHNAPDLGQGIYNLISVITARSLGISQEHVSVAMPDTSLRLAFMGVNSQRTTIQLGTAVYNACENLKQQLLQTAAKFKGGELEEWSIMQGHVCRAERSFSFAEIVSLLGSDATIESMGAYRAPAVQVDSSAFAGMDHWAPSAAVAEVEVDPDTGEFQVLQYAVAVDAGEMLHYKSAIAQLLGGAVMGFGHALFEEIVYADGQIMNADPFQYRLPVVKDLPVSMQTSVLEAGDGPGPFGSKGMSQTTIVTVAPAIGNALYDAIGARVRSLPITPEKILTALGKLPSAETNSSRA
jgi:CO/xanthine dehydrogenase Mo-binding subunit